MRFLAKKTGLKLHPQFIDSLFCFIIIGIIVGGRLGYVLFYDPIEYLHNPIEILKTWHGGMSFHGGAIGALFAIILVCKHYKLSHWRLLDLVACAAPIGIFLGRIANFINGELFGKSTPLPWGVVFSNTGGGDSARHPTQLYEALGEGLLLFMVLNFFLFKYNAYKKPRMLSSLFCIFYSLFRFGIEFLKEPDPQLGYFFGFLTMGQLLSLGMLGIGYMFMNRENK